MTVLKSWVTAIWPAELSGARKSNGFWDRCWDRGWGWAGEAKRPVGVVVEDGGETGAGEPKRAS